jgi:predicted MPP superfamily phosphohydrolase
MIATSCIFIAVLNFYAAFHGFLLVRALKMHFSWGLPLWIYWAACFLIAAIYFLAKTDGTKQGFFRLADAYWGLAVFLPFFLLADLITILKNICRAAAHNPPPALGSPLFQLTLQVLVVVGAFTTIAFGAWTARHTVVTQYNVKINKQLAAPKHELNVILVSDIHIGAMVHRKLLEKMVDKINAQHGDIVLLAGDIIDRDMEDFDKENLGEVFARLKAPLGVYAISGNHDYYGGELPELARALGKAGIHVLQDQAVFVKTAPDGGGFYLLGRKDKTVKRFGGTRKTLAQLERLAQGFDTSKPIIVMDHQPPLRKKPAELAEIVNAGVDLQVSGHTHGGQIWPGNLVVGRLYNDSYGLLKKGNTTLIVTSGYGVWGPEMRLASKSEIVRIHLQGN